MPSAPVRLSAPAAARTLGRAGPGPEVLHRLPAFRSPSRAALRGGVSLHALFLTLLLCLGLILDFGMRAPTRPGQPAQPVGPAEFDLRTTASSPKLNFISVTSSVREQTPTPQPETGAVAPIGKEVPVPEAGTPVPFALAVTREEPPGTPALVLPPADSPTPVSASVIEVPEYLRYPHRGDTPMMRTWNHFGLSALLGAALSASPARAQLDGEPEKADAILKQLQTITKSLEQLKSLPQNFAELEKKLADAEKRLAGTLSNFETVSQLQMQSLQRELNSLRDQYAQMKQEMDSLRKGLSGKQPTTALYPPAAAAAGRVRLVNTWPSPISVVVNNRTYRLEPNETRYTDPIPAGTFTYEVLGIQDRVSRAILPGETYLVHVHPR